MKKIEHFDEPRIGEIIAAKTGVGYYAAGAFRLVTDSGLIKPFIQVGQPYRTSDGRLIRVTQGTATYRVNLIDYPLQGHDLLLVPNEALVEMECHSHDFAVEVLVVSHMSNAERAAVSQAFPTDPISLSLQDSQWAMTSDYFGMIARLLSLPQPPLRALTHAVLSLVAYVCALNESTETQISARKLSHGEQTFQQFIALLRQYGSTERSIPFYADRLSLTANHLSVVIRQQTGHTVMSWINRTTVMEAKVLLRHTDLMMYEIAERLCFPEATAFGRYFKKQTGMTPLEYRERGGKKPRIDN